MAKEILTETVEVEPTAGSKDQVRALGHQDERAEIDGIFEGGPLTRWERKFGLSRWGERRLVVRALIAIAIGWVPLALINAIQLFVMRDEAAKTFFSDVAVHTRFLVAVPLLIAAESDCIPRLREVTRHFLAAGLIREQDRHRYSAAVASTQRLLNSTTAEIIMVALAYGLVVAISNYVTPAQIPPWHRAGTSLLLLLIRRMVACSCQYPAPHSLVLRLGMACLAVGSAPLAHRTPRSEAFAISPGPRRRVEVHEHVAPRFPISRIRARHDSRRSGL